MDPKLSSIVDSVLRSSSGENGKLVSYLNREFLKAYMLGYGFGSFSETARLDRDAVSVFPRSTCRFVICSKSPCA